MPSPTCSGPLSSTPSSLHLSRLLIVDDEVELLTVLCRMLSERGYEAVECTSGREALEKLKQGDFDLLLADLMMPEMDGVALIRAALEIDPQLVAIMMTGQGTVQTAVEAMKAGAFEYILKPFKLQALLPIVSRAIDVRRLRMENLQLRETVAVYELSSTITFTTDVNAILQKAIDAALQQCEADEASILLPTPEGDQLYVAVMCGEGRASLVGERVPIDQGIAGWVASHREPLLLHGEVLDPRFSPMRPRPDIYSAMILPLLVGGKLFGVLNVSTTRPRRFNLGQVKALTLLVNSASSAVEAADLFEKLRRAEEKYRSIVEHAIEGIFQITPDGRFVTMNPAIAHLLGYGSSEDLLAAIASIDHQLYVQPAHRADIKWQLETQGMVQGFETQFYRQDGSVIWVALNVRAVRDANGILMYYEGTAEDITERKRTERRLATQYAVTRILAEALDRDPAQAIPHILQAVSERLGWDWSVLWLVDRQARLLRCVEMWHRPAVQVAEFEADSWRRTFTAGMGLPGRVWANGQPIWIADVLRDADLSRASITAKEGLHSAVAFPIRLGNEILGVIECFSRHLFPLDHDMLRLFMTAGSEIGQLIERQRIEVEREQLAKHIRLLLESTGEGIFGLDSESRCTFINTSAAAMLGYQPEEVLGQDLHALVHHTRPDGSAYPFAKCLMNSAIHTGQGCHVHTEILWRRDGTAFPVDYTSYPILEEGVIQGAVVAFTDLTERKRTEEELQRQREALYQAEKVATMGELLAGVAHELNNPLSVVLGQALIMQQFTNGGPLAPRLETITSAAERCARVIKNFLALARQQPPGRQRVEFNQLIRDAVALLAYPLQVDTIEVHCDLAEHLPILWADADQLHQVVVNLVSNAHQAMRDTPPPRRLTLTTRAHSLQTSLELAVADTGPGIPIELQTRIFEPFFTTKPAGIGTGLGLSLCQGIVESHGGSIRLESEGGQGTVFRVVLPIQAPPEVMPPAVSPDTLPDMCGKAILIVDDEPEVASVLMEVLALDGHRAETASNGVMALSMIQTQAYDLILSDVRMPEMSGPELYRQVEQHHQDLSHRFIFLTGDTLSSEIKVFLEQTGSLYINKPFSLEEIRRVVKQALDSAR